MATCSDCGGNTYSVVLTFNDTTIFDLDDFPDFLPKFHLSEPLGIILNILLLVISLYFNYYYNKVSEFKKLIFLVFKLDKYHTRNFIGLC